MRTALKSLLGGFGSGEARLGLQAAQSTTDIPKAFGILSIAVAPTAKRQGVGSLLMQRCEQNAREWRAQRMHLTVAVNNCEAIQFYEQLGWEKEGEAAQWKGGMFKRLN